MVDDAADDAEGSDAGAFVWFVVLPNDSEKEQYTIRKHFEKCVGNVQKSPSNHFTVTPKLRPKHVRTYEAWHTTWIKCSVSPLHT